MTIKRRPCSKCGRNRAEKFFKSARARVCSTCQRRRVSVASRSVRLQETYGITEADYQAMFEAQGGACAICRGKRTGNLDVDHSHSMEKAGFPIRECVRGLLCRRCNRRLLPASTDKVSVLMAAIEYITRPPARRVLS